MRFIHMFYGKFDGFLIKRSGGGGRSPSHMGFRGSPTPSLLRE
jgi:hypothetical protein